MIECFSYKFYLKAFPRTKHRVIESQEGIFPLVRVSEKVKFEIVAAARKTFLKASFFLLLQLTLPSCAEQLCGPICRMQAAKISHILLVAS